MGNNTRAPAKRQAIRSARQPCCPDHRLTRSRLESRLRSHDHTQTADLRASARVRERWHRLPIRPSMATAPAAPATALARTTAGMASSIPTRARSAIPVSPSPPAIRRPRAATGIAPSSASRSPPIDAYLWRTTGVSVTSLAADGILAKHRRRLSRLRVIAFNCATLSHRFAPARTSSRV